MSCTHAAVSARFLRGCLECQIEELEEIVEQRSNAWVDLNALTERQAERVTQLTEERREQAKQHQEDARCWQIERAWLREALEELLGCPYNLEEASIPKAGIDAAPEYQVVGTMHVSLTRMRKVREALNGTRQASNSSEGAADGYSPAGNNPEARPSLSKQEPSSTTVQDTQVLCDVCKTRHPKGDHVPHATAQASLLVEQVCSYEDTLFKIAYPQKSCVGDCKCYDLSALKELARSTLESFNPAKQSAHNATSELCQEQVKSANVPLRAAEVTAQARCESCGGSGMLEFEGSVGRVRCLECSGSGEDT